MTEKELVEKYSSVPSNKQNTVTQNDALKEQVKFVIKKNVDDIRIKTPPTEELTKFITLIKTMPRDKINELIHGLGKLNVVNPNQNEFTTCTKKNIKRYFIRKHNRQQKQKQQQSHTITDKQ